VIRVKNVSAYLDEPFILRMRVVPRSEQISSSLFGDGDFLYNRKLSFLLYKKPPAGCAFARRSRMSQATALSARMCQGTFYISYIR